MKRQIVFFALGLQALCGMLSASRLLRLGIDRERVALVSHLPIVWVMFILSLALSWLFYWSAWQYAQVFNDTPQSGKAFPELSRWNAYSDVLSGTVFLWLAWCQWVPAYWSLMFLLGIAAAVQLRRCLVWRARMVQFTGWLDALRFANGSEPRGHE